MVDRALPVEMAAANLDNWRSLPEAEPALQRAARHAELHRRTVGIDHVNWRIGLSAHVALAAYLAPDDHEVGSVGNLCRELAITIKSVSLERGLPATERTTDQLASRNAGFLTRE